MTSCTSGNLATSFSFANFQGFPLNDSYGTFLSGPLTWTDMIAGDSSTYVYSATTINGLTYAVFSPSSLTITDSAGNLYEFISNQSKNNATAYTSFEGTTLPSGFTFTTYNMVATDNQISQITTASPPGLGISNCSITYGGSSGTTIYSFPSPAGTTINPTSCAYANGNTVFIGPGFVFGGNNIMFYSFNPWGDPTNTAVNSLPYSLGSSNNNTTTGTGNVFGTNANQYFGNVFSLPGSTASITGTNIMFVPYTLNDEQQLGAISFFLYSPYTTNSLIYNSIQTNLSDSSPVAIPYSGYFGYLYAYYDYQNIDISQNANFSSLALPTGYTPFLFDSQNFPSSNGSVPTGDFCFQVWSEQNNVSNNTPTSTLGFNYFESSTNMINPATGTTYQFFGAVPISFPVSTNSATTAQGQYIGNATYSSTSGIGGTPFCSGTLIAGSFLSKNNSFSSFFGTSNLTTVQQSV